MSKMGNLTMKNRLIVFAAAFGLAVTAFARIDTNGKNITVSGPDAVTVDGPELQIDVINGATATVTPSTTDSALVHLHDDVVIDAASSESWKPKVGLWLDASKPETIEYYCPSEGVVQKFCNNGVIERWRDARQDDVHTWRLAQYRRAFSGTSYSTHPVYIPATETESAYVSFNKNVAWGSRAWLFTAEEDAAAKAKKEAGTSNEPMPTTKLPVKSVVMVFGSQNGGGPYFIGNIKRASVATLPVPADVALCATDRQTWIDGASVDPCVTGLNGGWQIISMDMVSGDVVQKIGQQVSQNSTDWYGGQNFAEILFFTNALTVAERRAAEHYLATKWKVGSYDTTARATLADGGNVRLYGKGETSLAAGASVSVGGAYEGRLTVPSDAEVTFVDTKIAPTNPAWIARAADQTVLWYDPNRVDLSTYCDGKKNDDGSLKAKEPGHVLQTLKNLADQTWYSLVGYDRGAYWVDESLGFGPVLRWFDYRRSLNGYDGGVTRFVSNSSEGNTFDTRTGFMVLETTYGGTPLMDTSVYSSKTLYVKTRGQNDPVFMPRDGESKAFVTNSPAYLNGYPIKSGEHSFNKRGELLSFAFTDMVPVKCFGSYEQGKEDSGLRHGEVILTSGTVSEADRKDTEAYLMKKWLGILPEGYGDPSKAVIAGAGTVNLPGLVLRPQFDADFTGTVNLKDTVDFTIDATDPQDVKVVGAVVAAGGTVSLAAGTVFRVTLVGGRAVGKYTLVDAAALVGATPQLSVTGARGAFALEAVGGKLVLSVAKPGVLVIIR